MVPLASLVQLTTLLKSSLLSSEATCYLKLVCSISSFSNEDLISTKQEDLPSNTTLFLYFQIWSHRKALNSKNSFSITSKFKILAGQRMSFINWEIDERFKKSILIPHLLPNYKTLAIEQLKKRWRADSLSQLHNGQEISNKSTNLPILLLVGRQSVAILHKSIFNLSWILDFKWALWLCPSAEARRIIHWANRLI